ncbi:MAG: hypothetical protein M1820_006447 [Bogoriella megaspora]|nr:MAG: hypothetical protein M1820_006447 [Bogoriella megaspora]
MAYNRGYNPDALPAHAEPEQAAQMLSSRYDRPSSQDPYATKPPPPAPIQQLRPSSDDRYNRHSSSPSYEDPNRRQPNLPPRYSTSSPSYSSPQPPRPQSYSNPPPPSNYGYTSPPPPADYGQGPRPTGYHNRPPVSHRPPSTPAPPPKDGNDRDSLWPIFQAVDKDRSGHLSEKELRTALVNGDWSAFDPHTVRMMIRMFDLDRSGTIDFDEFCGLWGFLAAWRGLFDRFDVDRSGSISLQEFQEALVAFGYRLSPNFVKLLFGTYDKGRGLSFDLFVQACISLKRMTDVFKKYDDDRDGYITLSLYVVPPSFPLLCMV